MMKSRRIQIISHRILLFIIFIFLGAGVVFAQDGGDCSQLKKDYEVLQADHNNALAQVKILMQFKNKAQDMENTVRQFDLVKEQLIKEKDAALLKIKELNDKVKVLDESVVKLGQEKDGYKKSFEKATVENIIGDDTKKKIEGLEKERDSLARKVEDFEARIKVLDNSSLKEQAQTEFYKRQLDEVKDKYQDAKKKNSILERKLEETPRKFTELARENKILIKRTASMHYNLGVFYTQNKEFERAVAEFEKAVELNPEDAASYFNLGYIYAEHLLNRSKAVSCFKQFLKLAKKDDKDVDWAKRYILTWQTWEGNTPIK